MIVLLRCRLPRLDLWSAPGCIELGHCNSSCLMNEEMMKCIVQAHEIRVSIDPHTIQDYKWNVKAEFHLDEESRHSNRETLHTVMFPLGNGVRGVFRRFLKERDQMISTDTERKVGG